jgi:hypothetical protein
MMAQAANLTPPVQSAESLAKALEGVWVYVGTPGDVGPVPRSGGRFKFRVSNRWTYTEANSVTGVVRAHFGGAYLVRGGEYIETIDYSTDPRDPELRKTLKFTVKIEGDTMTQTGVGNPYTEVWKRVR